MDPFKGTLIDPFKGTLIDPFHDSPQSSKQRFQGVGGRWVGVKLTKMESLIQVATLLRV